jgi:hypothetical protein
LGLHIAGLPADTGQGKPPIAGADAKSMQLELASRRAAR